MKLLKGNKWLKNIDDLPIFRYLFVYVSFSQKSEYNVAEGN